MTQGEHTWVSETLIMFLVIKVGGGYKCFYFMVMHIIVEAAIMGLATSLQGCPISSLGLELSSIRNTAVSWPWILLSYQEKVFPILDMQ